MPLNSKWIVLETFDWILRGFNNPLNPQWIVLATFDWRLRGFNNPLNPQWIVLETFDYRLISCVRATHWPRYASSMELWANQYMFTQGG